MVMMERNEHALVPEWLRCTGNVAGGGTSARRSDISSSMHPARSQSFRSTSEKDSPRLVNGSSLSDSRRSSTSNGSAKHPYSSFTRSHREKNRVRVKEKSFSDDVWDHSSSEPIASLLTCGVERSIFRRSQSLVSRKPGEVLPTRVEDLKRSFGRISNSSGVLSGVGKPSGSQKPALGKDFPSLGTEEKQDMTGIRRALSPGLSSPVQNLPIGNSGFLGGEKWTSALAEVPASLANNGIGHSSLQQNVVTCGTSASGASSTTGLNMVEALSHPPASFGAATQQPDKSHRLEELAIKQSRQLIPMTPSMSKPLGLNSGDKSRKSKIGIRTSEMSVAPKGVQLQPSLPHLSNQSRVVSFRSDYNSTSHTGKFLVLKPGRENGMTMVMKDSSISASDADGRVLNGQHVTVPSTPTASMSPNKPAVSVLENKVAALSVSSRSTVEKRPSQSLAQSRSEFFKLMRRKSTPNEKTTLSSSGLAVSSPNVQSSGETLKEGHTQISHHALDKSVKENLICKGQLCPDEEEAAFLRSLGWEENGGEDEGLTEEEINAFYQEYMNKRPSLNACSRGSLLNHSSLSEIHSDISCIASSESSSSDTEA